MSCKPRTRLSLILPEIRFGGVWRLDSGSWNAAQEMPGMVDLIQSLQERGLTRGLLALKHRRSVAAGETHRYIVPVLGVDETLNALASGQAQVGSLPSSVGELGTGDEQPYADVVVPESGPSADPDDEPVDAELVDDFASMDKRALVSALNELQLPTAGTDDELRARLLEATAVFT
jgi:hypothetical protein